MHACPLLLDIPALQILDMSMWRRCSKCLAAELPKHWLLYTQQRVDPDALADTLVA